MKANIEVKDRREADAIRAGLLDPEVRAFVVVTGILSTLTSHRARQRVMEYVVDRLDENVEIKASRPVEPVDEQPVTGNGGNLL